MRETIQNANGKQFHAVSLSGGKDSTAMLLLMIEQDMPIDMVLSADTGMEFPEMYEHLAKLDEHLFRERGIDRLSAKSVKNRITEIRAEKNNVIVFCLDDGSEIVKRWKDRSRAESWTPEMREQARQRALQSRRKQK